MVEKNNKPAMMLKNSNRKIFENSQNAKKIKAGLNRGASDDPATMTECFIEHYDGFHLELKSLSKEKMEEFKEACRNILEGKDLATMLHCGDAEDVREEFNDLSAKDKKKVMDLLVKMGAIEDSEQDNTEQVDPEQVKTVQDILGKQGDPE